MKNRFTLFILGIIILATSTTSAVTTTFSASSGTGTTGFTNNLTSRSIDLDVDADGAFDFTFTWIQNVTISAGVSDGTNLFVAANSGDYINIERDVNLFDVTILNPLFANASAALTAHTFIRVNGLNNSIDVNGTVLTTVTTGNTDFDAPVGISEQTIRITTLQDNTRLSGSGFEYTITYDIIPEPSSIAFLSLGGLALLIRHRR